MSKAKISLEEVKKIARLANLPISPDQAKKFPSQLSTILDYMNRIQKIDTKGIKETSQVTGLVNVTRADKIEKKRILSQKQALANAPKSRQGYFVVPSVFK